MLKKIGFIGLSFLLPAFAFAQSPAGNLGYFGNFANEAIKVVNNILIPLVFALAFLVFVWGLLKYFIFGGGNTESQEQGKQLMIWGVVAFVVMVSLWGIVSVISTSLQIGGGTVKIPAPLTR